MKCTKQSQSLEMDKDMRNGHAGREVMDSHSYLSESLWSGPEFPLPLGGP